MQSVNQIIERNLFRRDTKVNTLWINPEKDVHWQPTAQKCTSLQLFTQDFGTCNYLKSSGANVDFSAFPQNKGDKYQWIIIRQPRQKALLKMLLDCAAGCLAADGVLWLAGENKAGIKSTDKQLKSYFDHVRKLDNARHCTVFEATGVSQPHSFDKSKYQEKWLLNCAPGELRVVSYPGVFAHGRLDPGTALLIKALATMDLQGDVLDFACGAGIVGACIAANNKKAKLTLLDTNALALKACEDTFKANHLHGNVIASDGLSELTGSFDTIVSNPPIHADLKTDNQLGIRLLEPIHQFMNPGSTLIIVANIHLPYEKWLSGTFRSHQQLLTNDRYKIIAAKL